MDMKHFGHTSLMFVWSSVIDGQLVINYGVIMWDHLVMLNDREGWLRCEVLYSADVPADRQILSPS
jgi:hypothetical protein